MQRSDSPTKPSTYNDVSCRVNMTCVIPVKRLVCMVVFCVSLEVVIPQATGTGVKDNNERSELLRQCLDVVLEKGLTEWQPRVLTPLVRVEWGYGDMTCSSMKQCFGVSLEEDEPLEAQLRPLQIQPGTEVRFFPSPQMDVLFNMSVLRVDEVDFRLCDMARGSPIAKGPQSGEFRVSEEYLKLGNNYFIANTTNHLYTCKYGLRLNVTVRRADCTDKGHADICYNRGRCVADAIQPQYECSCCHGYTGHYCEELDACASVPCQNGGTCFHKSGGVPGPTFTCECRLGFYGASCEKRVSDMCDVSPCENNATCTGDDKNYTCVCAPGYTGYHCEVNVNNCENNPCIHGVCVDELGTYKCFCTPGYGGVNCDRQYDECQSNPCRNNGFCIDLEDHFECHCSRGYRGQDCSIKIDLCNPSPCQNATECVDLGHDFRCTCKPGFTGAQCEINVNECESNPCRNGGICRDTTAGYRCLCPEGISGIHCEYKRLDLPRLPIHESIYHDSAMSHLHINNLYIVAGTLAGALLIALAVLAGCYCKVHETYRVFFSRSDGYTRQHNSLRQKRAATAHQVAHHLEEPRPSIDAILEATSIGYEDNSLNAPLVNSLKAKRV